ncbi:MAG TPA: hypothetical protein VM140_03615 [Burkholderiales bacterium]|nr:hypothetical protein [Burkholderiales bacterium]
MPSWLSLTLVLLLSGCGALRSYDREVYGTLDQASSGNIDAAIRMLDASQGRTGKDLLYYLEHGMLERFAERYPDSQKSWAIANQRIQADTGAREIMGHAASYLVGDQARPYGGHDYEKVMLLTYMALNQLAMGDFDNARVAIKQTHELEAIIAEQRAKAISEVEEQAKRKGARTSFKELNGYPVETIDNPAVNALKNSYQSALAHYLAGFVYEAMSEPSLAAPGYRLANELQPNRPLLEEGLRGLDERVRAADDGMSDVLLIISSGTAPAISSRQFRLPVFVQDRMVFVSLSVPVMVPTTFAPAPVQVRLGDGRSLAVTPLTSIDLMARRSLRDDMPSIMLRASIRSTANATAQYQSQRALSDGGNRSALVGLAGLAVSTGAALLEHADDRTWRTLPSEISIARTRLPRGVHTVTLSTAEGQRSARIDVKGRYAVVDLRLLRHRIYVHAPTASTAATARGSENRESLK